MKVLAVKSICIQHLQLVGHDLKVGEFIAVSSLCVLAGSNHGMKE